MICDLLVRPFDISSLKVRVDADWRPVMLTNSREEIHGSYIGNAEEMPNPDANKWQLLDAKLVESGPVRAVVRADWITASGLWKREQEVAVYRGIRGAELRQDTIWQGERAFLSAGWPGTIRRTYDLAKGQRASLTFTHLGRPRRIEFDSVEGNKETYSYDSGASAVPIMNEQSWTHLATNSGGHNLGLVFVTPNQQVRTIAKRIAEQSTYGENYWLYKDDFHNKGDRFREDRFLLADPKDWKTTAALANSLPSSLVRIPYEHTWVDRHPVRVIKKNAQTPDEPTFENE